MIQYFPIVTGSLTVLGNINVSGSITTSGSITISGSITSASFATSASNATNAISASYANNLTVAGTLTAQTIVVQTITSSVDFVTGSTRFGSILANTHVFSGSITMNPGGLFVSGSGLVVIGGTTPSAMLSKLTLVSANDQAAISFNNTYSDNRWSIRPGTVDVSNDGLGFYDEKNSRTTLQLTNAGNVLIGTTTDNGSSKLQVVNNTYMTMADSPALNVNRTTSDGGLIIFQKNGSNVGYIATNTYSLPSDLNFKKNINTLNLGLNLITKLRPVSYNHKIDDEGAALSTGFIAQELETSLTELGVEKNKYYILQHTPNEKEGESQYWLDYNKMIPVLTKAIQELNTKFEEYKATHP